MDKKLLRASEVAEILDLSVERVYDLAREGILPTCRLGRQLRFSSNAIENFINNGGKTYPGGWKKEA